MIRGKEITIKDQTISIKEITALVIKSQDDMKNAVSLLSQLNKYMDALVAEKEKVTKPMLLALKNERERFKPRELELEAMIEKLRSEMSRYQTENLRLQALEEAKVLKQLEKGKIGLEQATALVAKQEVKDRIETGEGSVKFKTIRRFTVKDIKKLPIEYHISNDDLIKKQMLNGIEIIGVTYFDELVPVNRR